MATRTGRVILARNIKMDRDYKNVLSFSESDMLSLVNTNKVVETSSASFVKVGKNIIDTKFSYADALKANYIALQNPNYSNKWFFAFIDDVELINNGTTRIYYTIDIFSTWWSYWTGKPCYVKREHVNNDTPGVHTIKEDVSIGEYVVNKLTRGRNFASSGVDALILATTLDLTSGIDILPNNKYNYRMSDNTVVGGIPQSCTYYLFSSYELFLMAVMSIEAKDQTGAIIDVFMSDTDLFTKTSVHSDTNGTIYTVNDTSVPLVTHWAESGVVGDLVKPTTLDTYTPVNGKVLTYPYCYILADNNRGTNTIYRYEFFENDTIKFDFHSLLCPGMDMKLIPLDYKNVALNYAEGIVLGKFPTLGWNSLSESNAGVRDKYNRALGYEDIIDMIMNPLEWTSWRPPATKGNTFVSDLTYSEKRNTIDMYEMCIQRDNARYIDDYFTKFGYEVDVIKQPNITGRTNFNYVKIGDSEVYCFNANNNVNIPADDLDKLNNLFRRGITIWHDYTNFGDYTVSNDIVTNNT